MARRLRREMSLQELLLWRELRQRPGGYKFRRQHPKSRFAMDFCCLEARLTFEVDGEAHNRGNRPERDRHRDDHLSQLGYETLRLPAAYVLADLENAVLAVVEACRSKAPPRNGEGDRDAQRRGGGAESL